MILGLGAGLLAAVAFGVAAVLQAIGARHEETAWGVDVRLFLRLLRQPAFIGAVVLTLAGFSMHLVALRTLPLFVVQPVIAGSVAITAVLSGRLLDAPLLRSERVAVAAVCLGLGLLTSASLRQATTSTTTAQRTLLLVATAGVGFCGVLASRVPGAHGTSLLGFVSGMGFAVVAIAARMLPDLQPLTLLRDPATYALAVSGGVAFLFYSMALQRGMVMTATSAMVVSQTVVPAAVGALILGDPIRDGWWPVVFIGLCLAVVGSVLLSRRDPVQGPPRLPDQVVN